MRFVLFVLLAGCAHHIAGPGKLVPYTVEYSIGDWNGDWFGDRNESVLEVHNTDPVKKPIDVACITDRGGADAFTVENVPANGSSSVLFQKLAKNRYVNMCHALTGDH